MLKHVVKAIPPDTEPRSRYSLMTYHTSELEQVSRTWAGLASNFIGACFDRAKPYLDKDFSGIDQNVRFVSAQLYIDCQLTSESVLILIREAKEWDADLLNRSVMEGSLKYVYMLLGTPEEIHMKVKEYWEILPTFSDIKHSERADRLISKLPKSDSLEWQPFRDLVLRDEEIDALRKEYTRAQRQELEERWSFSGISKQFMQSENAGLQLFGGMAHGYGMSSHLLHKDADGIGMVWERTKRSPHRQAAVTLGHAARVVSDVCTFAQLRLLYLLKLCGGDTSCIRELENDYTLVFKQLKNANTQFNWVEYGPMPNGDISENKK